MKKISWIAFETALGINGIQVTERGGTLGLRDEGLLRSALARPENLAAYGQPDLFDLAALYAADIIRNHPFVDGNKRTGFLVTYTFLSLNGWELSAPEVDAYMAVMALAQKDIDESGFAAWLKDNAKKITAQKA